MALPLLLLLAMAACAAAYHATVGRCERVSATDKRKKKRRRKEGRMEGHWACSRWPGSTRGLCCKMVDKMVDKVVAKATDGTAPAPLNKIGPGCKRLSAQFAFHSSSFLHHLLLLFFLRCCGLR